MRTPVELAPILAEHQVSSLLVVTSASHMRRAMATLSDLDMPLVPAASDFQTFKQLGFRLRLLMPSANTLSHSALGVHEIFGVLYYRMMGWI